MMSIHRTIAAAFQLVAWGRLRSAAAAGLLAALACGLAAAVPAEAQMQVATGTYVGNGLAGGQAITVGFQPDMVHVRGYTTQMAVASTSTMGGLTKPLGTNASLQAGLVTSLTATGFTVGDAAIDPRVNGAGIVYHWTALRAAAGELEVGTYLGNGTSQTVPVAFRPDWVVVFGAGNQRAMHRNSSMTGANSLFFQNSAPNGVSITGVVPAGFTVGSSADVNAGGTIHHYLAVKNAPGRFASGVFIGDGSDDRNITGIGLRPKWVIVRHTTIGRSSAHRPDTLQFDQSFDWTGGTVTDPNEIQQLLADGFQVGSAAAVNQSTVPMMWVAFGGPAGGSRVLSGRYTGNAAAGRAIYVGFQPDAVLVKRIAAAGDTYAVLRTATMTGDNTKDLDNAGLALASGLVQSLTTTGFTIGADPRVNANTVDYAWVAFKAGPGEMKVGTYAGGGGATQSVAGVGFKPDYLIVMPETAGGPGVPVSAASTFPADTSFDFDATEAGPDCIRALEPDGFQVGDGTGATNCGNLAAGSATFHYVAWKATPGRMAVGTYTGDGAATRSLDVAGFFPEWVIVKKYPDGATQRPAMHKPASSGITTDLGLRFVDSGTLANTIEALRPLGFQVGSDERVNSSTACGGPCTYHWVAFGPHPPQTNYRSIGTRAPYGTTHTDGNGSSVTATQGSTLVTCAGTCSWRSFNRGRGDVIEIDPGAVPYTVAGLVSESQLLLTTPYLGTTSGGKAYSIRRQHTTILSWFQCISNQFPCTYFDAPTASLVADDRREVGIAYNDSVFVHAARVDLNGATTDPARDIVLTVDPGNRHDGTTSTGVKVTGPAGSAAFLVRDNDVTIEWLEITGGARALDIQTPFSGTGHLVLRNNLLHNFTADAVLFIGANNADIYNNFIYQAAGDGIDLGGFSSKARILNNTIYGNSGWGITGCTNPDALLRNNIVAGNGPGDIGCTGRDPASSNNLTVSFTEGPTNSPAGGGIGGANVSVNPTTCGGTCVAFVSITGGSENLHLLATSYPNAARDAGASLTLFWTDIDGAVRTGAWDIGADEFGVTTAVKLQSLGARGLESAAEVSWRTASELSNLGFYLYRGPSADGPWQRITASLIPGLGSSAVGQAYSYVDRGLSNGTRYYYRLEDVDASSKVTSHGPVSAVPQAGVAPGDEGEGTGARSRNKGEAGASSCPAWVLAAYGASAGSDTTASSLRCTRHGDPEATSFLVLSRDSRQATVELRTGGFYALHEPAGTLRVFVPGFEYPAEEQAAALPVRRALVDAVVGRRVELGGVRALDLQAFRDLVPSALGRTEMLVGRDGTVRAGRRGVRELERAARSQRTREAAVSSGAEAAALLKSELVRLLPSQFQGETKSAVLELVPLRWDAQRRQLSLAKRVRVKLLFTGREAGESGRGSVGRAPRAGKPAVTGEVLARLHTTGVGLHAVTFEQLFAGRRLGVAVSELRLERQGEAVALHVEPRTSTFGPGSRLYFHAERQAASTDYAGEVAYELRIARDGLRMEVASAAPGSGAVGSEPVVTRRFETNRYYQPGLLEAADPWLWEAATSGATRVVGFSLAGVSASGSAELSVDLQGASESGQAVDHHVSVSVNGTLVGEAQFAGKRPFRMSLSLAASLLREGTNDLSLTNVGDTGVTSLVFLDGFTLVHPQPSSAAGGRFEGVWQENGSVSVQLPAAVSGPVRVVDVTARQAGAGSSGSGTAMPVWLSGLEANAGAVRFRVEAGHRYRVESDSALFSPRIAQPEPSDLKSAGNQADYLLIAPRALLPAAEPLVSRRQDQGLSARAVSFEEIAAEFGHGQPSAEAIREFVSYAFHSWTRPSPRYVLLLGDSSYDPRNFSGVSQPSPLPVLWTKTSYLWTASDPLLGAVNGEDSVPDLSIGRLPATSVEQAEALVRKLLAWEDSGQGLSGAATLVADNPDLAGDFEADVEDIRRSFLASREAQVLKLGELGAALRSRVQAALDGGLSHLNYVGHGGAAVWASENVWNSWDAASLQAQSQQPLLLTLNCLNGYFVAPTFESLAESLIKAAGRGAIASVSPSGLSLDGPAHQYHRALMAELTSGRHTRLGDALLAAQRTYAETGLMPELLAIYHLLGDPAMTTR